jgi:hypothetical protein
MSMSPALIASRLVFTLVVIVVMVGGAANAAEPPAVKITYLYDNTSAVTGTDPAWGFAALVEAYTASACCSTPAEAPRCFATT